MSRLSLAITHEETSTWPGLTALLERAYGGRAGSNRTSLLMGREIGPTARPHAIFVEASDVTYMGIVEALTASRTMDLAGSTQLPEDVGDDFLKWAYSHTPFKLNEELHRALLAQFLSIRGALGAAYVLDLETCYHISYMNTLQDLKKSGRDGWVWIVRAGKKRLMTALSNEYFRSTGVSSFGIMGDGVRREADGQAKKDVEALLWVTKD